MLAVLTACNEKPISSNAILAPRSPIAGTIVDVLADGRDATFVLETRIGEQIGFPIQGVDRSTLERYQENHSVVTVVSEVHDGRLRVVSVDLEPRR